MFHKSFFQICKQKVSAGHSIPGGINQQGQNNILYILQLKISRINLDISMYQVIIKLN